MPQHDMSAVESLRRGLYPELRRPFQLPEPAPILDMEARRGDRKRTFKYLHQMCTGHAKHFVASSKVKQLFILDGYLSMARAKNPYGIYAFARTGLELAGLLFETNRRLLEAVELAQTAWDDGGQKFFGTVVRSRFATKDPALRQHMLDQNVSRKLLDPLNVMACIESLTTKAGHEDALDRYGHACDFLHHNLGSATLANAGSAGAQFTRDDTGVTFMTRGRSGVTQYQYPNPLKCEIALERTGDGFLEDMRTCKHLIANLPLTPYSDAQLLEFTGTTHGFQVFKTGEPIRREAVPGRNAPCPCGSGKKFKNCCAN